MQLAWGVTPQLRHEASLEEETPLSSTLTFEEKRDYLDNPLAFLHLSPPSHVERKFYSTGAYGVCGWEEK